MSGSNGAMARNRDFYETLGVSRTASSVEIKAAYRSLALRFHPDRNPGDVIAEDRFKQLSEAYAVLSDPDQRARYDRFGALEGPLAAADVASATEFFDTIFGDLFGIGRRGKAGQDLRYTLELEFEEAALGCEKPIRFARAEDCRLCSGTGAEGGAAGLQRCARCEGQGYTKQKGTFFSSRRECTTCGGSGEVPRIKCVACHGTGMVERERHYLVRIPPGSTRGVTQRVPGEGSPGRRGGVAGDLTVVVRVRPHPFFSYREEDGVLVCEVPITPVEAALGGEVEVPALEGSVRMKVPPGTQPGAVFRIRGRGVPRALSEERGDLHIRVAVETPAPQALSADAQRLYAELADALGDAAFPRRTAFRSGRSRPA